LHGRHIKIVEASTTSPSKESFSRSPILEKKIPRVEFKENIIVERTMLNRKKIPSDGGNTKNVFKM
jgi:hypothetical protein